jgi:hypothetical protein
MTTRCPSPRRSEMPPSEHPNWQPISQLPLIAGLIDDGIAEATAQRQILTEARARPHLLDDATLDRVDQVYGEEQQWLGFCEEQLRQWQQDQPAPAEAREIARLAMEIERLKPLVARRAGFWEIGGGRRFRKASKHNSAEHANSR